MHCRRRTVDARRRPHAGPSVSVRRGDSATKLGQPRLNVLASATCCCCSNRRRPRRLRCSSGGASSGRESVSATVARSRRRFRTLRRKPNCRQGSWRAASRTKHGCRAGSQLPGSHHRQRRHARPDVPRAAAVPGHGAHRSTPLGMWRSHPTSAMWILTSAVAGEAGRRVGARLTKSNFRGESLAFADMRPRARLILSASERAAVVLQQPEPSSR